MEEEVRNIREFRQALSAGPDIIMLDNFNLADIKKAVRMRSGAAPELEVSGGVNLANVRKIAGCGVDRISIGGLTHSARSLDVSLDIVSRP